MFDLFTRSPKEALFAGFLFSLAAQLSFFTTRAFFSFSPKDAPLHQMCFQRNLKSAEEMRRLASRSISGNMPGTFEKTRVIRSLPLHFRKNRVRCPTVVKEAKRATENLLQQSL